MGFCSLLKEDSRADFTQVGMVGWVGLSIGLGFTLADQQKKLMESHVRLRLQQCNFALPQPKQFRLNWLMGLCA